MNTTAQQSVEEAYFGRILREKEFWILVFAALVLFARPLFNSETFFFRDLYLHFYPQKKLVADLLRGGELPLWDKYIHGGQPLMANMNNAAIYPTAILYLLLPSVAAFNIDIVLHLIAAAAGAYALSRVLGLSSAGALACGAVYGFCGLQLSLPNVWLYAAAHAPFLLLFWHLFWKEHKKRWLFLLAGTGVLQVLAGRPEWPPLTWTFLLLWTLAYPYSASTWKKTAIWGALAFCVLGLASVQIVPMWELIQQSTGTRGADPVAFTAWSIAPQRLPELVIPGFFGRTDSAIGQDYFGGPFEDQGFPYMLSIYFGSLTLLLATLSGLSRNPDGPIPPGVRKFLFALTAFFFLLSLGKYLPEFSLLHAIPVVNLFRYPSKLLAGCMLPVALLAGLAVDMNFIQTRAARWMLCAFLAMAAGFSAMLLSDGFLKWFSLEYFQVAYSVNLLPGFLHCTAVLGAAMAILLSAKRQSTGRIQVALGILILLDLSFAGRTVNAYAPADFLKQPPAAAKWLQENMGEDFRLYRTPTPANLEILTTGRERYDVDRWHLATLDSYMGAIYGLRVIFHEDLDRLGAAAVQRLGTQLQQLPWENRVPILSSASIRYFVSSDPIQHPAIKPVFRIKNDSNRSFYLFENMNVAAPVRFCNSWLVEKISGSVPVALSNPSFDPRNTVLLEEAPSISSTGKPSKFTLGKLSGNSTHSSYALSAEADGFLVYSETNYPGWKFTIDGSAANPVAADYAFSAIPVPAGNHVIGRIYRPASVVTGAILSLIFAVLLIVAAIRIPAILNNNPGTSPGGT